MPFETMDATTNHNDATRWGRGRFARLSTGEYWAAYCVYNTVTFLYEIWSAHGWGDGTPWTTELVAATAGVTNALVGGLAVDSADTLHLVYWNEIGGVTGIWYCSRPAAGAWSAPADVAGGAGFVDPVVAVDAADNVIVVYVTILAPGHLWYRPLGGAAEQVDLGMGAAGEHENPSIAFDSAGNLHIISHATGYGANPLVGNIQYAMRTPAGAYTRIAVTDLPDLQRRASIAIGPADDIHICWNAGALTTVYATKALADAAFGAAVDVGVPVQFRRPTISVDRAGDIYIVGDQWAGG